MTMDEMRGGEVLAAGAQLEEFEIERELGAGGFGVTYLAHDRSLDRQVAIKEYLPRDCATRHPDGTVGPWSASATHAENYRWGLERFLGEARVLAKLHHPHVVQVYRVIEAWCTAYMVMEYVEGRSLAEALRAEGPWPESRVLSLLDALMSGLEPVHAAGLVHRDITPANVMLRGDGSPVLIDFGAARQAMGRQSRVLSVIFTAGYAPYEQYNETGRQGPWTDVYALGAVAYEALSGRVPVQALARMEDDTLRSVAEVAAHGVSPGFAAAIGAALAVRGRDRPQSLADWRSRLGLPSKTVDPPGPVDPPEPPPEYESEETVNPPGGILFPPPRPWSLPPRPPDSPQPASVGSSLRWWWAGAGAAVVVAVYVVLLIVNVLETAERTGVGSEPGANAEGAASETAGTVAGAPGGENGRGVERGDGGGVDRSGGAVASPELRLGALMGEVTDGSGVLPGVAVLVQGDSPASIEEATTDDAGRYNIIDLRPGIYTVTMALPGFFTLVQTGIEVQASTDVTINGQLAVGWLEETITVSHAEPSRLMLNTPVRGALLGDGAGGGWVFDGWTAGQEIRVAVGSDAFDTVVELVSPTGAVIDTDDDGGRGTDSLLEATLPVPGRYQVLVTAYNDTGTGTYTVAVHGEVFRDCPACPEMVVIPAGTFMMGSPASEEGRDDDEDPRHEVSLRSPFALGRYEVTRAEYAAFVSATSHDMPGGCDVLDHDADNGSTRRSRDENASWRSPGFAQEGTHPTVCVNWWDAQAFVGWLSRETGQAYRLPSEAEWEYATRAGWITRRWWGADTQQCEYANGADATHEQEVLRRFSDVDWNGPVECTDGSARTAPVGSFSPNAFGLHDVLGNVWEWVEDCWHGDYSGAPSDGTAWKRGGNCGRHMARGGSWSNTPRILRSANRNWFTAGSRRDDTGFRVSRTLD